MDKKQRQELIDALSQSMNFSDINNIWNNNEELICVHMSWLVTRETFKNIQKNIEGGVDFGLRLMLCVATKHAFMQAVGKDTPFSALSDTLKAMHKKWKKRQNTPNNLDDQDVAVVETLWREKLTARNKADVFLHAMWLFRENFANAGTPKGFSTAHPFDMNLYQQDGTKLDIGCELPITLVDK